MKKSIKISWGLATLLPIVFLIVGIVAILVFLIPNIPAKGTPPSSEFPAHLVTGILGFYGFLLLTILTGFLIHVSYFIHLIRTDQINKDHKTLWVVLFLVLNILAMIVYWFIVVWPEPEKAKTERGDGFKGPAG
jgi:hypothetical protein